MAKSRQTDAVNDIVRPTSSISSMMPAIHMNHSVSGVSLTSLLDGVSDLSLGTHESTAPFCIQNGL